jgi:hypothetical protein
MTDDAMAALRKTLFDRLLRFTTRTDLSVTACVAGTSARREKRARNLTLQHDARSSCRSIGEGDRGPEILDLEQRAELSPGAVGYNERARSGQRLRAVGEVWRLADDPPLLRSAGPDQVANDDETAGDADPHLQPFLCGEPADRVDDR